MRILLTNDDGWDAPGLAALYELASQLGEVHVLAPREPHSYAGHRVTTDAALHLEETGPQKYSLTGTPADCVRVGLMELFPQTDLVLAGINRGGNLGADLYISGTVAAVREAALLGKPGIAVSQYLRKGIALDWEHSRELAELAMFPLLETIRDTHQRGDYWNINLPHLEEGAPVSVIHCDADNLPLDVRFEREGPLIRYSGSYPGRPRTEGRDIDHCFRGSITISRLRL